MWPGIRLSVWGEISVHLKPTKAAKKKDRYVLFEKQMLVTGNGKRKKELDVGQYQFPFSVSLPSSLPCSLETKYCHVRYLARVEMIRPWKFDHQAKVAFSVSSTVDLNQVEHLLVIFNKIITWTLVTR